MIAFRCFIAAMMFSRLSCQSVISPTERHIAAFLFVGATHMISLITISSGFGGAWFFILTG